MNYGKHQSSTNAEYHLTDFSQNILSLKAPLQFKTSVTSRCHKWAATHDHAVFGQDVLLDSVWIGLPYRLLNSANVGTLAAVDSR